MFDSMLCASMSTQHCPKGKIRLSSPGRIIPEAVIDNIFLRNGNVIVTVVNDLEVEEVNLSEGVNIYPVSTDIAYVGNFIHSGRAENSNQETLHFADIILGLVQKAQPSRKLGTKNVFLPSVYMVRDAITLDGQNILKPFDLVSVNDDGKISQFKDFELISGELEKYLGTPSKSLTYALQSMCKSNVDAKEIDEDTAEYNLKSGRISKLLFTEAMNIATCQGIAGLFWLAASTAFSQDAVDNLNASNIAV